MNEKILLEEYKNLCGDVKKVYVIPLINFSLKKSNYLYLLYKNFIENNERYQIQVQSISIFSYPRIVLSRLINEKAIVHHHWLEITDIKSLSGMFWKIFWLSLFKLLNGKIVWTVHNKFPHKGNFKHTNKYLRRFMAKISNRLHVHCASAVEIIQPILKVKKEKFFIAEHPEFPSKIFDKSEAREQFLKKYPLIKLNENDKLFLMFGEIGKYKGIQQAVKIFDGLEKNKKLFIAGRVKKGNEKYFDEIVNHAKNSEHIFINGNSISENEIPVIFNSSDFVLFNYRDVLTSGSVFLALSYNKKVIIPDKGCLKELSGEKIIKFENDDQLKNILINL